MMTQVATISIPESDRAKWLLFLEIARREGGLSKVLRNLAFKWLNDHGEVDPAFPATVRAST